LVVVCMILKDKAGQKREHTEIPCDYCGKLFYIPTRYLTRSKTHYCSSGCKADSQRERVNLTCALCGKEFSRTKSHILSEVSFCSRDCKDRAQRIHGGIEDIIPDHYKNGKASYRRIAKRHYVWRCEICGYDEHELLLQVHHIDSNRENNEPSNLIVLCPNCHTAITLKYAVLKDRKLTWLK